MDKVSVLIETRLECGGEVTTEVIAVVPVHEEDIWLDALAEDTGEVLEATETPSSDCEYDDGARVYVLCSVQGEEIVSTLYVTDDEEDAAERAEAMSEERQEDIQVVEASFCSEGDE